MHILEKARRARNGRRFATTRSASPLRNAGAARAFHAWSGPITGNTDPTACVGGNQSAAKALGVLAMSKPSDRRASGEPKSRQAPRQASAIDGAPDTASAQGPAPADLDEAKLRQQALGARLRQMFDDVMNEPVPGEFLDILRGAEFEGR